MIAGDDSVQFYEALQKANVPAEVHLYGDGPHGFGLAQQYDLLVNGPTLCENWLRHQKSEGSVVKRRIGSYCSQ